MVGVYFSRLSNSIIKKKLGAWSQSMVLFRDDHYKIVLKIPLCLKSLIKTCAFLSLKKKSSICSKQTVLVSRLQMPLCRYWRSSTKQK